MEPKHGLELNPSAQIISIHTCWKPLCRLINLCLINATLIFVNVGNL